MPCIWMTSSQLYYEVVDQMTLGDGELLMLPLFHGPSRHHLGEQPSPMLIYRRSSHDKVFHATS
jgi:hypothetical protein